MKDCQNININLIGILMVFLLIVTLIYMYNSSLDLIHYILFAVNIILIIVTLILGLFKGLLIGILMLLCYGVWLLYSINIRDFNNHADIQYLSWFLIFPLSIYLSANITLLNNNINKAIDEEYLGFDSETDLYNLRTFYRKTNEEIARAENDQGKLYMAIIKMKYFNELTHIYGNKARGQVLLEIRDSIISNTKEYEFKARISQGSFAIIIPAVDEDLKDIKKRLNKFFKKINICLKSSSNKRIQIETQIGVGEYIDGENAQDFKHRVENELQYDVS